MSCTDATEGGLMFDKFGEFDSVEELNRAAEAQKAEGDTEAIFTLAAENGIDKEDAQDYIDNCTDELATRLMAATGKIEVESQDLEIKGIIEDWKNEVIAMCMGDTQMCEAVRKKGKRLGKCLALLIKFAFENKTQVSNKVVDLCKIIHNGKEESMRKPLYLGIPNRAQVKQIVREYYLG